jgi:prepilin-type N-terminal cleavage/methylation domain-containing protein
MRRGRPAGFTLIELMIALVLAGIVLGAIYQILQNNQRFYRSETQILDVQQGVRAVAQLLPSELREVDARAGDIVAMGPDSITIRALRNTYFVCAPPVPASGTIITRTDLSFGYEGVNPAQNRALVFRDGNTQISSDDQWVDYGISSVTAGGVCTDGSGTGKTWILTGTTSKLDSVTVGSPVRTYEELTYRLYVDSTGVGWLGVEQYSGGSWGPVSPIAGPLNGTAGIALAYYDSTGTATGTPTSVAQVGLTVRGMSEAPIAIPGRRANLQHYQDSVTVRVALRNNS